MHFTSAEILVIITAFGGLVTIIGGVIVNIILSMRKRVDETLAEAKVITGHVNSAATRMSELNTALIEKISTLERVAAESRLIASNLAQAAAIATTHSSGVFTIAPVPSNSADESLKKIDENTAGIEKNTAKDK